MVLVLFFVVIILSFIVIFIFSTLKIKIEKLEISNEIDKTPLIKEIQLCIGIYFLGKIKILQRCLNKQKLEKVNNSNSIQKLKDKFLQKDSIKESKDEFKNGIEIVKNIKPSLEEFKLDLKLGTEDVLLTSFFICIISIVISLLLSKTIKKYNEERYKYIILPDYNNKNSIKIVFSGILQIKLVNIINTILKLAIKTDKKVIKGRECEQV